MRSLFLFGAHSASRARSDKLVLVRTIRELNVDRDLL
jgi:hypothetical protein